VAVVFPWLLNSIGGRFVQIARLTGWQ